MNSLSNFYIGSDISFRDFFDNLNVDAFPRFNTVLNEDKQYCLELALPGWHKDSIKLKLDAGILTVEGAKQDLGKVEYLHKGITSKAFKRSFLIPRNLEVSEASLTDGILGITFANKAEDPTKLIAVQ